MQCLTCGEIAKACGSQQISGDANTKIYGITTDTRKAGEGTLFVPLTGERFDGHDFIDSAFDGGAAAVITHKKIIPPEGKVVIEVADTLKAFGDIAKFYINKYRVPIVSVTGSVGKTTTKDMIAGVLETSYDTLKTEGNFNNEIGVPITALRLEKEHEAAVIEMGMSAFGEIERLADIVRPDIGVITNIGMSHIENLGSREGIFKAKMEITTFFTDKNVLIVNGDNDFLSTIGDKPYRVVSYGIKNACCDVKAKDIEDLGLDGVRFTACVDGGEYPIEVYVAGEHNIYNALAAICVGREMGIPMENIRKGIAGFRLTKMRMDVEKINGITLINDCYNASPDSMNAALKVLSGAEAGRRIAVLGDMLEMGSYADKAHYGIGQSVAENGIDILITAGEAAKRTAAGAEASGLKNVFWFPTAEGAGEYVSSQLKSGDAVLVKASRGMHFETVAEKIKEVQHD